MAEQLGRSITSLGLVRQDEPPREPSLVVDLDGPIDAAGLRAARSQPRVLVGFSTVPGAAGARRSEGVADLLDTVFVPMSDDVPEWGYAVENPAHSAYGLASAIRAWPRASLVCAEVLRTTATMAPLEALAVESQAYSALLAGTECHAWRAGLASTAFTAARDRLVRVERDGDVLRVRLDHPERRNSYSVMLRDQLADALRVARLDPTVTRVELSGEGPSFCSGGDLAEIGTPRDPAIAAPVSPTDGVAPSLLGLADRLTVRMQGPSVGAGVELAAFAGRVVASPDLTVRMPNVQRGLLPGVGGTVSIPRRIGRWRTAGLLLSGTTVTAETLLSWGLVDEITDSA